MLAYTAIMFFRTRNLKNKIAIQNEELGIKNNIIEARNKDITDSIEYAGRIQNSIIPSPETLQQYFKDSFVLFRPKDIVSGDFYWVEQSGKEVILAVADCTGHGIPGALMSVIGANLLNEAVNQHGITQPAEILNRVRKNLIAFLQKNNAESGVKDGMDICIISWNKETQTVQYAGAYNALYVISDNKLTEYSADKTPVGIYFSDVTAPFTNLVIPVKSGDRLYLFTDGFADQFGGPRGKKFKYKQMQNLFLELHQNPMHTQKENIERTFEQWKGNLEQVDDVCVVGVRV
ncbi:MAG: hypothetical protein Fur0041_02960 [Bacteroidia bacterium]